MLYITNAEVSWAVSVDFKGQSDADMINTVYEEIIKAYPDATSSIAVTLVLILSSNFTFFNQTVSW